MEERTVSRWGVEGGGGVGSVRAGWVAGDGGVKVWVFIWIFEEGDGREGVVGGLVGGWCVGEKWVSGLR